MRGVKVTAEAAREYFWAHVQQAEGDACWKWLGSTQGNGYGQMTGPNGSITAHRYSWELHFGPIPRDEKGTRYVCHHCDNKGCPRPGHLFLGDARTNELDLVTKGLHYSKTNPEKVLRGERHGMARLTEEQVREIRRRLAWPGTTLAALGQEYGVTKHAIYRIKHRLVWQQIEA